MKRRAFIGSLLGAFGANKSSEGDYQLIDTRFTGTSSQPLDGRWGSMKRFFKEINGFEMNEQQLKWLASYGCPRDQGFWTFEGQERGAGITTFAETVILYNAIREGKQMGIMSRYNESTDIIMHILNNPKTSQYVEKYRMLPLSMFPVLVIFKEGGLIHFLNESAPDRARRIRLDEIWRNCDGVKRTHRGINEEIAIASNFNCYWYGSKDRVGV